MPDDLAEQINWVHQACEALGVPIMTQRGYEADDVIGTMAARAADAGFRSRSCRSTRTSFSSFATGPSASTTHARTAPGSTSKGVVEKFGVKPSQVVDVLALVGDTSDNVAGVPGIGKKGAIDLITQFGSLDGLLARTAELKPKQREALETNREAGTAEPRAGDDSDRHAPRSRLGVVALSWRVARALLRALYATRIQDTRQRLRAHRRLSPERLRARHDASPSSTALVSELRAAGKFAIYVITDQPNAMRATIVGIAVSTADRQGRYIPVAHRSEDERNDLLASASAPPAGRESRAA